MRCIALCSKACADCVVQMVDDPKRPGCFYEQLFCMFKKEITHEGTLCGDFSYEMEMKNKIEVEDLLDALDSVTWYNGFAEEIMRWKDLPYSNYGIIYPIIEDPQIEVIWMICCVLFGDYGTSPRSGWITDREGFYEFIDAITKTQRRNDEEVP